MTVAARLGGLLLLRDLELLDLWLRPNLTSLDRSEIWIEAIGTGRRRLPALRRLLPMPLRREAASGLVYTEKSSTVPQEVIEQSSGMG